MALDSVQLMYSVILTVFTSYYQYLLREIPKLPLYHLRICGLRNKYFVEISRDYYCKSATRWAKYSTLQKQQLQSMYCPWQARTVQYLLPCDFEGWRSHTDHQRDGSKTYILRHLPESHRPSLWSYQSLVLAKMLHEPSTFYSTPVLSVGLPRASAARQEQRHRQHRYHLLYRDACILYLVDLTGRAYQSLLIPPTKQRWAPLLVFLALLEPHLGRFYAETCKSVLNSCHPVLCYRSPIRWLLINTSHLYTV